MLQSEPQFTAPIEDQILEAIISGSLPPASPDAPLCTLNSALCTPQSLASHFRLPLSKILDILASPLTRTRIAAAQELRDLAFHQREQLAREKALAALESILDTSEDPIEKRRAATAILRRSSTKNPFWPRTPGAAAAAATLDTDDDEDDDTPPTPLPSPSGPKWCTPARQTLIQLLTRLQDNHNPEDNAGLITLFLHKDRETNYTPGVLEDELNDYLEDPGEEAELTNFSCAILHTPDPGNTADVSIPYSQLTERVTLHWPTHRRTVHFNFTASRTPAAVLWKIADIDIGPKESDTDSS